jgi:hypothetical protein
MEHPPEDVLLRFILGAASRQENRQVVRHLLARCPSCASALRTLKRKPPPDPDAYDQALVRLAAKLQELTRRATPPRRPDPVNAKREEDDPLESSLTSGNAARRPFVFG